MTNATSRKNIKNNNYIIIQGFMINELNLRGNELLVYAIIHGFSQTEDQKFTGSLSYLSEWTSSSKQGIQKNLKSLIDKGFIKKDEDVVNGIKQVSYYTTQLHRVCNSVVQGYATQLYGGMQLSCTNNINNNINNKIEDNNPLYSPLSEIKKNFETFWNSYPKKKDKAKAEKWFIKNNPNEELFNQMLSSLEQQKKSKEWLKDNGKYIPYPTTWLNGERWNDEISESELDTEEELDRMIQEAMRKSKENDN